MRYPYKIVRFDLYCKSCVNKDVKETEEPCNKCLEVSAREETAEPEEYKEDKTKK